MKTKNSNKGIKHILLPLLFLFAIAAASCGGGGGGGDGGGGPSGGGGGGNAPDITVTDTAAPDNDLQIPFGTLTVGIGATLDKTVTITNNGTADLVIGTIASANPLAAPFSKPTDNCSGWIIVPGGSCTLTIRFAPTSAVSSNDSFDIPSNDPDENPVTVSVSGTGAATTVPDITVTDSVAPNTDLQIPFGNVLVGTTSTQTVTIINDSAATANLIIGTITPPGSAFGIITTTNCSDQTLAPGASCTMSVDFTPGAVGSFSSSIVIPSNDPDAFENPVTVNLSGIGDNNIPPMVTSTSPVDGGSIVVGGIITATFSEPMNSSTLTTNTFTLVDDNQSAVAGAVSYSTTNNRATFNPTGLLTACTGYTATITTGATDLAGNGLAADYSWVFTTLNVPPITPCP